jgi:hypothetical protein
MLLMFPCRPNAALLLSDLDPEKHFGKGGNSARMHCMRHVHALPILGISGWRG